MKKVISLLLCFTLIIGVMPMSFAARDTSFEETLAEDLKQLGLFYGVSYTDFDLDRAPTRVEALVMLIRVLGSEKEALAGNWKHPFTDVPAWADKYVGFGYERGLANGVGLTTFGTGRANAAMYLTFVLRALGYSDAYGEFTWDNPFDLAKEIGVLTNGVDTANFWRADVVLVSYAALDKEVKGSGRKLADTLISAGVFTADAFNAYYDKDAIAKKYPERVAKTSEEIYQSCKDAVFYVQMYDENGEAYGLGSGFFIDSDGTAVTNYHVIEKASEAYIWLSDEETVYEISGVLQYSKENDWAVIKVNGSGFSYLPVNTEDALVTGSSVYALGSPLGLQNTFSEGIISNPKRVIGETPYIQITAPISQGSSGGALLNKYGEAIGITSALFENGQNLNLAVPLSIVDMSESSYVISFAELQQITGMLDNGSGTGSSGSSSGPNTGSSQQQAFNALKTYILRNSNYTTSNEPARRTIKKASDGSEIWYVMSYDSAYNWIYLTVVQSARGCTVSLTTKLDSVSQECLMSYSYEEDTYYSYNDYVGEAVFDAKLLYNNSAIVMTQTDGAEYVPQYKIAEHEERAGAMLVSLLSWADTELYAASNGEYNMAYFGYWYLYS